jgi:hypothetical protein
VRPFGFHRNAPEQSYFKLAVAKLFAPFAAAAAQATDVTGRVCGSAVARILHCSPGSTFTREVSMRSSILAMSVLVLSGCASLAAESASRIGCDESEITTSNAHLVGPGVMATNWNATCKGRIFICSRRSALGGPLVACSPKI